MSKSICKRQGIILSVVMSLLIGQMPLYAEAEDSLQKSRDYTKSVLAPIRWTRSSEEKEKVLGVVERKWDWQTANSIETPITEEVLIWDGPYNSYYRRYIDKITGKIHSSATWKTQNRVDLRRFRGYFEIPEGYTTEDFVRLSSVVQEQYSHLNNGNIIPINDNIYVFVYPEEVSGLIDDNSNSEYYFMNYLAFWTGTANKTNNGVIQSFYGKSGTYADRNTQIGPKVTDGWYAEATIDNIGNVMHETTGGASSGTKFVIDIFTEDNSPGGGGGMDEMVLEFEENPKAEVHAFSETYAIPSNKMSIVQETKGLLANDSVNKAVTAKIIEGTNDAFRTVKANEVAYDIYKDEEKVAHIAYADERGQFVIKPENNYVGEIQFDYEVKDKLEKFDVATAYLYVMPYVDVVYEARETQKVLLQVKAQYGNPYGELPEDIIWINGTANVREELNIEPLDISKLDKNNNYDFIQGEINQNGEWVTEVEVLPYTYKFTQANQEINLQYEVSTKDVQVNMYHQYEYNNDDDDYNIQMSLEVGTNLQVEDYIDTTANGKYAAYEKYEIDEIEIYEMEAEGSSRLELANIKGRESIILEGDKVYELTFKYKRKEIIPPEQGGSGDVEEPDKPSVPGEGTEEPDKPSVPGEGTEEPDKPSVPGEGTEEPDKPSIPGEGTEEPDKPSIPGEDSETPEDEVEIPDEDLPAGPINPGIPEIPSDDEDEIEIPDETLPGTGTDIDDSITTPEMPDDEIEIPDEEVPSGPINPEIPGDTSNGNEIDEEHQENTDAPGVDESLTDNSGEISSSEENNKSDKVTEKTDNPQTGDRGLFWQIITLVAALFGLSLIYKKKDTSR